MGLCPTTMALTPWAGPLRQDGYPGADFTGVSAHSRSGTLSRAGRRERDGSDDWWESLTWADSFASEPTNGGTPSPDLELTPIESW